jgi:hypothetical protein
MAVGCTGIIWPGDSDPRVHGRLKEVPFPFDVFDGVAGDAGAETKRDTCHRPQGWLERHFGPLVRSSAVTNLN